VGEVFDGEAVVMISAGNRHAACVTAKSGCGVEETGNLAGWGMMTVI